ncbi:dihydrofolate reductase family protein [Kribbella sp. NPDC051718]|uniref:RibD family protein n=1 Tax=Kribbella sp. NPDC051718 TaxID=3155168 RepID=UPI003432798F
MLVGANTIRQDTPPPPASWSAPRTAATAAGLPFSPTANFFTEGAVHKLVYTPAPDKTSVSLGEAATVIEATDLQSVLRDLTARGSQRLMVEGGTTLHTQFLTPALADELHLVIPPFVGDPTAARLVAPGTYPQSSAHRMNLTEVRQIGDVVSLRYLLEVALEVSTSTVCRSVLTPPGPGGHPSVGGS